jgi:glycosyltransferase involved in cell wall biosynthesis
MRRLDEKQPLVSVIIPTFNSGRILGKCLSSIEDQSYRRLEVIVVDDGSRDSTVEIAKRYRCKVFRNPRRGRAEAKNEGIRRSVGEYCLFLDSDMELDSNVIDECVSLAESDHSIGGIVIPERSIGNSFWVRVRDFERSYYIESVVESARFFPSGLVKEARGFEEELVFFEESTLPYKIHRKGYNVFARVKSPIFHHEEDFQLYPWLRKKFHYGKTAQRYRRGYGDYSKVQIGIWFRLGLFAKDQRRFWSKPKLALGVVVLKTLEYLATTSGLVYSKS